MKDLVERQDRLEVMMEVLMRKMDKLSIKIISRHDVPSHNKKKEVKKSIRRVFSHLHKSVVENSDDDDIVNHGRKSHIHQNPLYETQPIREFGGRFKPNRDFSQGRNFHDHDGLGSIKLKILAF